MTATSEARVARVIRHEDKVHLGSFAEVLEAEGYRIEYVDAASAGEVTDDAALVIVLGGSMGVYESDEYPFIVDELELIARRLEAERPTLGVCLGAQLMSEALGGRVSRGKSTVIGFREVQLTDAGRDSPLRHFDGVPVFQWHGDSFRLPAGATRLASSAEYSNEAFRMGDFALAIQFHAEMTPRMYERWAADSTPELTAESVTVEELLAQRDRYHSDMQRAADAMLTEWLQQLPA